MIRLDGLICLVTVGFKFDNIPHKTYAKKNVENVIGRPGKYGLEVSEGFDDIKTWFVELDELIFGFTLNKKTNISFCSYEIFQKKQIRPGKL